MARPLTLLPVRHGQSEWNARGLTHGDTIRAVQAVAAGRGPSDLPAVPPPDGSLTRVVLAR